MPLAPRDLGDLLAEDVRRLDADEVYSEALAAWTGIAGLNTRASKREHIWYDPSSGSEGKPTRAGAKAADPAKADPSPAAPAPKAAAKK